MQSRRLRVAGNPSEESSLPKPAWTTVERQARKTHSTLADSRPSEPCGTRLSQEISSAFPSLDAHGLRGPNLYSTVRGRGRLWRGLLLAWGH